MKTFRIAVRVFQTAVLPALVFFVCFYFAPQMQANERLSFFSTMAQILATLFIALAVLPRFQGVHPLHWSSLLLIGLGEACAIAGAVPGWSTVLWQPAFALVLSSASVAIFAILASVSPAIQTKNEHEEVKALIAQAERLDPTPPSTP